MKNKFYYYQLIFCRFLWRISGRINSWAGKKMVNACRYFIQTDQQDVLAKVYKRNGYND